MVETVMVETESTDLQFIVGPTVKVKVTGSRLEPKLVASTTFWSAAADVSLTLPTVEEPLDVQRSIDL
jgi:hypothetical protein